MADFGKFNLLLQETNTTSQKLWMHLSKTVIEHNNFDVFINWWPKFVIYGHLEIKK